MTSFAIAFAYLSLAQALVFPQSQPTPPSWDFNSLGQGFSPRPTEGPHFYNLDLRAAPYQGIFERQASANFYTCGWYNGNADTPITCGTGYGCALITGDNPQYFACCPVVSSVDINWGSCPYFHTCLSYGASGNAESQSYPVYNADTLSCPSASPACTTVVLNGPDDNLYYNIGCGPSETTYFAYQSASNKVAGTSTKYVTASVQATHSEAPSSTPESTSESSPQHFSNNGGIGGVPSNTGSSASSSTSASSTENNPSSTTAGSGSNGGGGSDGDKGDSQGESNQGSGTAAPTPTHKKASDTPAIAGGVVGGVAALGIIGGAIAYMVLRKRKQRLEPMREISPGWYAANNSTNY